MVAFFQVHEWKELNIVLNLIPGKILLALVLTNNVTQHRRDVGKVRVLTKKCGCQLFVRALLTLRAIRHRVPNKVNLRLGGQDFGRLNAGRNLAFLLFSLHSFSRPRIPPVPGS